MAVAKSLSNNICYYIIFGVYAVYGILYAIKHNFSFRIIGRIVFVLGECMMVAVFAEDLGFVQVLHGDYMRIVYYANPKYYKDYHGIIPVVTFSQTVMYGNLLGYIDE